MILSIQPRPARERAQRHESAEERAGVGQHTGLHPTAGRCVVAEGEAGPEPEPESGVLCVEPPGEHLEGRAARASPAHPRHRREAGDDQRRHARARAGIGQHPAYRRASSLLTGRHYRPPTPAVGRAGRRSRWTRRRASSFLSATETGRRQRRRAVVPRSASTEAPRIAGPWRYRGIDISVPRGEIDRGAEQHRCRLPDGPGAVTAQTALSLPSARGAVTRAPSMSPRYDEAVPSPVRAGDVRATATGICLALCVAGPHIGESLVDIVARSAPTLSVPVGVCGPTADGETRIPRTKCDASHTTTVQGGALPLLMPPASSRRRPDDRWSRPRPGRLGRAGRERLAPVRRYDDDRRRRPLERAAARPPHRRRTVAGRSGPTTDDPPAAARCSPSGRCPPSYRRGPAVGGSGLTRPCAMAKRVASDRDETTHFV